MVLGVCYWTSEMRWLYICNKFRSRRLQWLLIGHQIPFCYGGLLTFFLSAPKKYNERNVAGSQKSGNPFKRHPGMTGETHERGRRRYLGILDLANIIDHYSDEIYGHTMSLSLSLKGLERNPDRIETTNALQEMYAEVCFKHH